MADLSDIDENKPDVTVDSVPVCDGYTKEIRQATKISFGEEHHLEGPHKILYGDTSSRPGHGFLNRLYYNFQTKEIERDTGAGWIGLNFWKNKIKVVTYNGDGLASKSIVGIGGEPIALFLIPAFENGWAYVKLNSHPDPKSYRFHDATIVTDGVLSLDSDGFTVGIDANGSGIPYSAICLFEL